MLNGTLDARQLEQKISILGISFYLINIIIAKNYLVPPTIPSFQKSKLKSLDET
jgi:hypothetical protein